jgi:hypothetical protein
MGGNTSKSSVQQVNEFFNKTTNDFVSANSNKVDASNMSQQSINAAGATIDGCRVNFNQTITSGTVSTGKMENKSIQDLTTELKNKAQTAIDNAATQKNGFLNASIANSTSATTNLKNTVTNIIENKMKSTNVQEVFSKAQNVQVNELQGMTMKCYPAYRFQNEWDLQVNQNIKSDVVAKGVADNLTQALSTVIADNTSELTLKQSSTQTNAGLDDLIKALTEGWGLLILGILLCLCMALLAVPLLMSGGGGGKGGNASSS